MQTVKTVLTLLLSIVLLGACGLKGPLYLDEEESVANPATNQELSTDTEKADNKDSSKKKKTDPN
jgi:predicted small lipoprotein YifL